MARPRKDPERKLLTGTLRPDREPTPIDAAMTGPMAAPTMLSEHARAHFERIAGLLEAQSRSSPYFVDVVALLAQRLEQIERFQTVLSIEGDTARSTSLRMVGKEAIRTEMIRARPEVAMLSDAMRHAQTLLTELMLSPTAAMKIAPPKAPETNEFDF